jgi:hypothetical protein
LGIGTNAPTNTLSLFYNNNSYQRGLIVRNNNAGTNALSGIALVDSAGVTRGSFDYLPSNFIPSALSNTVVFASDSQNKLGFIANSNATGGVAQDMYFSTLGSNTIYQMQIKGNGNIQINTNTDAGFRLDVNGTTRLNGNTSIGGGTAGARLDVRAQGALSTDIAFRVRNSADSANLVSIAGNGNTIVNGVLNLNSPALSGRENIIIAKVSDNNTDVFGISNGTFIDGRFSPAFYQYSNGSYGAINFRGLTSIAGDSGTTAMLIFQCARTDSTTDPNNGTFSALSTRPLFSFNNQNNIYCLMFANGNLHLQNGGTFTDIESARLAVNSTTQGFLPPRMTTTEKNAIASPAAGLVVYDSTLGKLCVRTASAWETITSS